MQLGLKNGLERRLSVLKGFLLSGGFVSWESGPVKGAWAADQAVSRLGARDVWGHTQVLLLVLWWLPW